MVAHKRRHVIPCQKFFLFESQEVIYPVKRFFFFCFFESQEVMVQIFADIGDTFHIGYLS